MSAPWLALDDGVVLTGRHASTGRFVFDTPWANRNLIVSHHCFGTIRELDRSGRSFDSVQCISSATSSARYCDDGLLGTVGQVGSL